MPDRSQLPSIGSLIDSADSQSLIHIYGRDQVLQQYRAIIQEMRVASDDNSLDMREIFNLAATRLKKAHEPKLKQVINATGIVLHTNLGRAPLSKSALEAMQNASEGYSNLEFDLENGKRGSRSVLIEDELKALLGVEAGLVVNNNAGAVLLCLSSIAKRRKAVIGRSQLVEIGGGFRIPDVIRQSGAILLEVGTTNKVHLSDFENALEQKPVVFMRAHHSNFKIIGFTSEPEIKELVELAHANEIKFYDDLGSGALLNTEGFGLAHEPTVQESLAAGADLVSFSGDKLVGGPQAGIIVGKKVLIDKLKKHPLARALRADKVTLAGLQATLAEYRRDQAIENIPVWQMIAKKPDNLQQTAIKWQKTLGIGEVRDGLSAVGGGSLPEEVLPTWLLQIVPSNADDLLKQLRQLPHPIIARIEKDCVLFDPRTVLPKQEELLLKELKQVLK